MDFSLKKFLELFFLLQILALALYEQNIATSYMFFICETIE